MAVVAAASVAIGLSVSPTSAAAPGWTPEVPGDSGAVTGAGFGPTLGVGDPSSYTGGSTSNNFCYTTCGAATIGVGGPSSYTGGATSSNRGGTATWGSATSTVTPAEPPVAPPTTAPTRPTGPTTTVPATPESSARAHQLEHIGPELLELARADARYRDQGGVIGG